MAHDSVDEIKARLKAILAQVEDPNLPMDEILALYEEAVKLGSKVGEVVEGNISEEDARTAFDADAAAAAASKAVASEAASPESAPSQE
ncbi:MAG: exodeoxyribonuclease VII small subunit [Eggerthellaceae bacterium]|nr:exodeoxyribonuclease VII small subunit [Eggerthellaceae bacterium]